MQLYTVGGYVRDMLLRQKGIDVPQGDRDWVVVGATPEEMLKAGFTPVGSSFPVFLHPTSHDEYALARTERKTAAGYHGFSFYAEPSVTLEEDLRRRDLTINAIAMDEKGNIIDPYHGRQDLDKKLLRHVSEAFLEDPVRILRVGRFCAKLPEFTIAPETLNLMKAMVANGEADALVPERIWAEFYRGMGYRAPLRMLDAFMACGVWKKIFGTLKTPDSQIRAALTQAVQTGKNADERIALLFSQTGDPQVVYEQLLALRAPAHTAQLAQALVATLPIVRQPWTPELLSSLFQKADGLRRPERMHTLTGLYEILLPIDAATLKQAFKAWAGIDAGAVAKQQTCKAQIPAAIRDCRVNAVKAVFQEP